MKFLVIISSNSRNEVAPLHRVRQSLDIIKNALESGWVENAWILNAGGHVLLINADTFDELNQRLLSNPFYQPAGSKIIPVMEVLEFMRASGLK
jgi:hypothetical protein